jgi:hemerythrin-like domain-containing protein
MATMETLEKLLQEHREAARLMDLLEEQARSGENGDLALICDIMHYMTHYPDLFHHRREDAVLRALALKRPDATPWLGRVEREHAQLADAGRALMELLRSPGLDDQGRRQICRQALDYTGLLRAHMSYEERELFPAARAWLDAPDWEEIDRALPCPPDPLSGMGASPRYQVLEKQYRSRLAWLIDGDRAD